MEEEMMAPAAGEPSQGDEGGFMDSSDWAQAQFEADKENGDIDAEGNEVAGEDGEADIIPQRMVVRHNKQDVELRGKELAVAAQKGLDYDRIRESRDRYMEPIDRLARQAGVSTDQFMKSLEGMVRQNVVGTRKSAFLRMGVGEQAAEWMAQMQWENDSLRNAGNAGQREEIRGKISRDITAFEKKFPQVQELPDDVIGAIRSGESPVTAYQDYLLRENDKKLRALEQNTRNRTGSPGSAQTIGAANEDSFLAGFLSL